LKLKLTIDGKTYEVEVEASDAEPRRPGYVPPSAAAARDPSVAAPSVLPPAAAAGGSPMDERQVCRSPIAGVVVRVSVQIGQAIQVNDVLMVLEAMKMETTITSPVAGQVSKVNAAIVLRRSYRPACPATRTGLADGEHVPLFLRP
jgi:methylmalonyl-CoA carboxyltransferase small subunit